MAMGALRQGETVPDVTVPTFVVPSASMSPVGVVERTSRELKDRFGLLAYGMSVLQTLAEPLTAHYRLTLDGHELETEGASLLIANAGSLGRLNLHLGPIITPDDGLLDVMLIGHDTDIVLSMAATLVQLDELTASVQHWQAREVHIEADPVQNTQVDGDVLGQTPATATVLPGAVRILTPQGSATRPR